MVLSVSEILGLLSSFVHRDIGLVTVEDSYEITRVLSNGTNSNDPD